VRAWRDAGLPPELGWHPCLTLDRPVAPPERVPSLVAPDGRFWPLRVFLARLARRRVRASEVEGELRAQYRRFLELVGRPPAVVNSHQHVSVFPPVGAILLKLLAGCRPRPFVRRVRERWAMLARIRGARVKRALLTTLGRIEGRRLDRAGFPGPDWLAGVTDPPWVADPDFFVRWLTRVPGRVVELMCHPGHHDVTLIGRDCRADDGPRRRVAELRLLRQPGFADACRRAGFTLISPSAPSAPRPRGLPHAA
jgi:predicted glycoside hydrolase/deacetylase ChbG (UPF0249 family)